MARMLRIKQHYNVVAKCEHCNTPVCTQSGSHLQFAGDPWHGLQDGEVTAKGRCPGCNERYTVPYGGKLNGQQ